MEKSFTRELTVAEYIEIINRLKEADPTREPKDYEIAMEAYSLGYEDGIEDQIEWETEGGKRE